MGDTFLWMPRPRTIVVKDGKPVIDCNPRFETISICASISVELSSLFIPEGYTIVGATCSATVGACEAGLKIKSVDNAAPGQYDNRDEGSRCIFRVGGFEVDENPEPPLVWSARTNVSLCVSVPLIPACENTNRCISFFGSFFPSSRDAVLCGRTDGSGTSEPCCPTGECPDFDFSATGHITISVYNTTTRTINFRDDCETGDPVSVSPGGSFSTGNIPLHWSCGLCINSD